MQSSLLCRVADKVTDRVWDRHVERQDGIRLPRARLILYEVIWNQGDGSESR